MSSWSGFFLSLLTACASEAQEDPPPSSPVSNSVDPFVGTGGPGYRVGSSTPAATLPFGMVKIGPDTSLDWGGIGAYHCSGYYWDDTHIEGFSHFHMHGTGVADYGDILFMPTDGWDPSKRDEDGYRAPFSHDNERASPGSYAVTLDDGISVTLAATRHAAHHEYVFPEDAQPVVIIDLEHVLEGTSLGGEVQVEGDVVKGYMTSAGSFATFPIYFYAVFDGGIAEFGTWGDDEGELGRASATGTDLGAWIVPSSSPVGVRVGISLVSVDGTQANVEAELPVQKIETTAALASVEWEDWLGEVEVTGGSSTERTLFYTALYHALQMPTEHADADGSYVGFDGEIHVADFVYHSDFSLWDTYRTAHPLYTLLYPAKASDFAKSLLAMAEEGGAFPRWPAVGSDSQCMIGAPADIVLTDTWLRGVRDWDIERAWPLMRAQARGEGSYAYNARPGIAELERYGYLPADLMDGSVAWTHELAWADVALSHLAEDLGAADDAAFFAFRSYTFENQWDPEAGFFHARYSDGTFGELDPLAWADEYTEGNAWQYLWMPFPRADALAETLGGTEAARGRLTTFFEGARTEGVLYVPQTWYWHGNEPDIHAAFLFQLWGDPDASLLWQRWIRANHYAVDPHGLAGNDDAGTLSAWYVFSALGFYPIAGTATYVVGVPLFEETTFPVTGGRFTTRRVGDGDHVAKVTLNGVDITRPTFQQDELVAGGSLVVELE